MNHNWIAAALFLALSPFSGTAQEREITRYLRSYQVPAGQTVDEVVCIGCSVTVAGSVTGDVIAIGGDLDISGTVGGDAIAAGGRITLRQGSRAAGDLVTVGGSVRRLGQTSTGVEPDEVPYVHLPGQRSLDPRGVLTFASVNILLALIVGGLLRFRRLDNIAAALRRRTASTAVLGVILSGVWVLLVVVSDDAPRVLEIALWAVHGILLFLLLSGCAGLAWLAGNVALPKFQGATQLALGALIWTGLLLVPLGGTLAFLVAVALGLGAAARSRFGFSQVGMTKYE